MNYGSRKFYDRNSCMPKTDDEHHQNGMEFEAAGFSGACASTDAVNIVTEKLSWIHRQQHLGCKQNLTARTCDVYVNHQRRLLHVTPGFPARWNDKTIVKFDHFTNDIRSN